MLFMDDLPACNCDGQAVSVEVQPLLFRPFRFGIEIINDPAENIRSSWWVLETSVSINISYFP